MVRWLRLCIPKAGMWVWTLVGELTQHDQERETGTCHRVLPWPLSLKGHCHPNPSLSPHTLCDGHRDLQPGVPSLRKDWHPSCSEYSQQTALSCRPFKNWLSHRVGLPKVLTFPRSPTSRKGMGPSGKEVTQMGPLSSGAPVESAESVVGAASWLDFHLSPSWSLPLPSLEVILEHFEVLNISGCASQRSQPVTPARVLLTLWHI